MRKSDISGLRYTGGGAFSTNGPWRHGAQIIESFALIPVTRGTVAIREGDTRYTLKPKDYLLQDPEKTIFQIALELNLFEKFFRYHQHCSPTQYRSSFSRLHTNHR